MIFSHFDYSILRNDLDKNKSTLSWPWHLSLICFKSSVSWLELCGTCWVYFQNNTMTVWNRFYVWLDYGATDIIVARPRPLLLFLLKDGFSVATAMKGCTAMVWTADRRCEILARAYRVDKFGRIVDSTFLLEHKSHNIIFI